MIGLIFKIPTFKFLCFCTLIHSYVIPFWGSKGKVELDIWDESSSILGSFSSGRPIKIWFAKRSACVFAELLSFIVRSDKELFKISMLCFEKIRLKIINDKIDDFLRSLN